MGHLQQLIQVRWFHRLIEAKLFIRSHLYHHLYFILIILQIFSCFLPKLKHFLKLLVQNHNVVVMIINQHKVQITIQFYQQDVQHFYILKNITSLKQLILYQVQSQPFIYQNLKILYLKSYFKFSGKFDLPAYPGFIVTNIPIKI